MPPKYQPRKRPVVADIAQSAMFSHAGQVQAGDLRSTARNLNADPDKEPVMLLGEAARALGLHSPIPLLIWNMQDGLDGKSNQLRLIVRIYQGKRTLVIPISEVNRLRISTRLARRLSEQKALRGEAV